MNEKTEVCYQSLCMDADGVSRISDICLRFDDAMRDIRARNVGLHRPDRQQFVKMMITHYIPVEEAQP